MKLDSESFLFAEYTTCTVIRKGHMTHKCETPSLRETERLGVGAVVVCTCGRRYKSRRLFADSHIGWDRRYLPWPRAPKEAK